MYKFELERFTICYIYEQKKYVFSESANPQIATSVEGQQI